MTTTYVWDGAHMIAEYEGGSLTKKYIYGPGMDNPVAMIDVSGTSETWYYYYADALGSVRLMTDASGTPVESYTYDVYGTPRVMTSAGADGNWLTEDMTTQDYSSVGNPYLFTGRRWDSDTGLYYYRFRDYAPELGRFCQTDPLGYIDTMNQYAYCGNNPLNWIDPWGLDKTDGLGENQIDGTGFLQEGREGPWDPFRHLSNKEGWGWDFKTMSEYADKEFVVPGRDPMTPSEFGNYFAGYTGYYHYGAPGYAAVSLLGDAYEFFNSGNNDWIDDLESRRDIKNGVNDAPPNPDRPEPSLGMGGGMPF